jgi:hypothetical protein
LVVAAASAVMCACGSTSPPAAPTAPIPRQLLAEARPIGSGPRFRPPVTGNVIGPCRPAMGRRFGVHVEVFAANRVVIVPDGIGVRPPVRVFAGRISSARCYGRLVTLEPTGLVLARRGRTMSLGDLFREWGEPLSRRRLASFTGRLAVFVDGRRWRGPPGSVPLLRHAEIAAEIGPYVPPHATYAFPPGT